jgi:hypothetical protein
VGRNRNIRAIAVCSATLMAGLVVNPLAQASSYGGVVSTLPGASYLLYDARGNVPIRLRTRLDHKAGTGTIDSV